MRGTPTRRTQTAAEREVNKMKAYWAGKNPKIVLPNPNKEDTGRQFITHKANDIWGHPKDRLKPKNEKGQKNRD